MTSSRILSLALLASLAACQIEKIAIPQTTARLAVHAVLSATASSQVVLLERTRTGAVTVSGPPFELENPFVADDGIAESGATITLTTPDGQTLVATEDKNGLTGNGVYRFALLGNQLVRGGTYHLSVLTTKGETLSAETSVPGGVAATFAEQRVFDRESGALLVQWPAVPGARSYFVRIETPFGPRSFFTDSTEVRLPGDLRNVNVKALPHVFLPGFPQAVTVSAVDSNYYDWYRTHNEELSGTGLVNRVQGGIGVFGSLVRVRFLNLSVVAPQTVPASGTFRFTGTAAESISTPYLSLQIYLESTSARGDQGDALSGRYERQIHLGDVGCAVCGLLGTKQGDRVELVLLRDWFANDTAEVISGEFRGDTIVGTYLRGHGGIARFVKKP